MSTVTADVTITYELGMHARPATAFTATAARFQSDVTVARLDRPDAPADGKAMLGLLALALTCGTEIRISATGCDAQPAVDALVALVQADFKEPEREVTGPGVAGDVESPDSASGER